MTFLIAIHGTNKNGWMQVEITGLTVDQAVALPRLVEWFTATAGPWDADAVSKWHEEWLALRAIFPRREDA